MEEKMDNKSKSKKENIFQITLGIAVVALLITVAIQARSINSLNKINDNVSFTEKNQPVLKTVSNKIPIHHLIGQIHLFQNPNRSD